MAVDTRDKRFSMLGLFQPVPSILPNPDGAIDTQDRAMLLYLYYGLALEALVPVVGNTSGIMMSRHRRRMLTRGRRYGR